MLTETCLKNVLLDSVREVFETMVFMDIEEAAEPCMAVNGNVLLSSITFKGRLEGCIGICCTEACACQIASNMIGIDPDNNITSEHIYDAIGEIINMVMGKVEMRLEGDYGPLKASIPSVTTGLELRSNLGNRAQRYNVLLNLEDMHTISLSLICRENDV